MFYKADEIFTADCCEMFATNHSEADIAFRTGEQKIPSSALGE